MKERQKTGKIRKIIKRGERQRPLTEIIQENRQRDKDCDIDRDLFRIRTFRKFSFKLRDLKEKKEEEKHDPDPLSMSIISTLAVQVLSLGEARPGSLDLSGRVPDLHPAELAPLIPWASPAYTPRSGIWSS